MDSVMKGLMGQCPSVIFGLEPLLHFYEIILVIFHSIPVGSVVLSVVKRCRLQFVINLDLIAT